jgi:hypothetical protein
MALREMILVKGGCCGLVLVKGRENNRNEARNALRKPYITCVEEQWKKKISSCASTRVVIRRICHSLIVTLS